MPTFIIELPASEMPVSIDYIYTPGRPATMYKNNGDPGDPAEPAEVEIEDVTYDPIAGVSYSMIEDLSDSVMDYLNEKAMEDAVEREL